MRFLRRLSPLAPWKLLRTLDEVRELPALRTKVQKGLKETKTLQKQIRDERKELAVLSTRVQQFEAVYKSDTGDVRSTDRALKRIGDARVAAQLRAVVAAAPLESDPCPHIVLDDLFPDDAYDVLVAAIPPPMFFEHLSVERQDLKVPLQFAPRHHREVWQAFHTHIVMNALVAALFEKFRTDLDVLARTHWPGFVDSMADAGINLHPVMSRIMRRRPGYEIKPHRDPRWVFLTCILYLTQRDDPQVYGTQLCRLQQEEEEAPSHAPFWVREDNVEVVREVPGRPNSAVVFLNSTGAHRASIPSDAPPETDRYIYQMQLGPEPAVRAALNARLPAEHARRLVQSDREFKY